MRKTETRGKVYVLGDDLDTDQMIPAEHLVYDLDDPEERKNYGRYALSSVPTAEAGLPEGNVPFVVEGEWKSDYRIIVGGKNFGCGSSREHAPFALREAGIEAIVARFYARIFFRNCVNGGYLIPYETPISLVESFRTGQEALIRYAENSIENLSTGEKYQLNPLGDVLAIVEAGDVFAYAKSVGMLET